jgi:hypothetical protein
LLFFVLLGRQDSNLRMSAPKADALPLGDAPLRLTEDEENQTGAEYTHNMIKSQPLTNTTLHTGTAKGDNHCFNKLAVTQGNMYLQLNHPEDRPDSLQEERAIS